MKVVTSQVSFNARNQATDFTQRLGQSISRGRIIMSGGEAPDTRRSLDSTRSAQQVATSTLTHVDGTQAHYARSDTQQSALRLFATTQASGITPALQGVGNSGNLGTTPATGANTYSLQELSESTRYQLSGQLTLDDGKNVDFNITGAMQRSMRIEEASGLYSGKLQQKDPLILNFAASSAQLTQQAFDFDIDNDGQKDQVSFATGGSGFLFLDRNGNGALDNGSELFGAKTGNGFGELAMFDDDGNGFIDSGDAIYAQLKLASRNEAGEDTISSLTERNIGALGLQAVNTEFEITDDFQQSRGRLRATGVAVSEAGNVMTLQQVDLTQRSLRNEAALQQRFTSSPDDPATFNPITDADSAIAEALRRLQEMTQEMQQRLRDNAAPQEQQETRSLLELLVERFFDESHESTEKPAGSAQHNTPTG